ncbi:MAG TPA: UDP-glucose/GDP-mannose dehydrogenase family protein [Candidatus Acidoferrales bacterium]|nr:UDP-glucose/GDP-mannose dehydrogenase family protein [Candidatus Acidoferrales bacterium]
MITRDAISYKIAIIGAGYVGLVTAACFAELGYDVVCIEKSPEKIRALEGGSIPFFEPGLEDLVRRNAADGRLHFTSDLARGIRGRSVAFIAVGTPSDPEGRADLRYVREAAVEIAKEASNDLVVVNKSTVPVETADLVARLIRQHCGGPHRISVASNPEFLREGSAISDFMHPDRVVIGASSDDTVRLLSDLYAPLNARIFVTDVRTAEMIKYTANAFLATKISFVNEIANICQSVGADVKEVALGAGLDKRIGTAFFNAGLGFGGSCFPKDVRALVRIGESSGVAPRLLSSVLAVNSAQVAACVRSLKLTVPEGLHGQTIAVLGLAFKPETDDVRESPAIALVRELLSAGAIVRVHDPEGTVNARSELAGTVYYGDDAYDTARDADAVVVATEWSSYQSLDFTKLRETMRGNVFYDARNVFDPLSMESHGFRYLGVGRRVGAFGVDSVSAAAK